MPTKSSAGRTAKPPAARASNLLDGALPGARILQDGARILQLLPAQLGRELIKREAVPTRWLMSPGRVL